MMAPEDTEDLISKIQTKTEILLPRAAGTTMACFFVLHFLHLCLSLSASVPKVEQIDQRLGPLVQEFKDLVYPNGYNPESKPAAKRKTGQSSSCHWSSDISLH